MTTDLAEPRSESHVALAGPTASAALYRIEIVPPAELGRLAPHWQDLALRAIEPNALFAPGFALAALRHLADVGACRVAAIWREEAGVAILAGLVPLTVSGPRLAPWRTVRVMAHNYGPLGTPLLDRAHAAAALDAMLGWLRVGPLRAHLLVIPFLPTEGAVYRCLVDVATARSLRIDLLFPFLRGLAVARDDGSYGDHALGKKKRHDLARQRRRLEERGPVTFLVDGTPETIRPALAAFLSLEASGWKGRAGTATLQRPDRARFLEAATLAMADKGMLRLYRLVVGEATIAAGLAFLSGDRAWFLKIAYDESLSRFSPGIQLALFLTEDLLSLPGIRSIDSVADPGNPMIDHLYRERLALAHAAIDLTPGGSFPARLAIAMETVRRSAARGAKHLLIRLRRMTNRS
jgi:CelD/BcsL family acetyltransferase involved in cellulose biosynthesis